MVKMKRPILLDNRSVVDDPFQWRKQQRDPDCMQQKQASRP
jgi:hypothetical protein